MIGVNLSGAEFGQVGGAYGWHYIYPSVDDIAYYAQRGVQLVRLPVKWERLQTSVDGPLDQAELGRLIKFLGDAQTQGVKVIVDLHNFGGAFGSMLGMAGLPETSFADFWKKLASAIGDQPALAGYDLMNEPQSLAPGVWPSAAQAAVNAIRQVDTSHTVYVEGEAWANAVNWSITNANLDIKDSANKLVYEAHVYFDANISGTYQGSYDSNGAYPNIGVDRVQNFIDWLAAKNAKGFLGEFSIPNNDPRWLPVLDNFLTALDKAGLDGTYWGAGPWWGSYPMALRDAAGGASPALGVLQNHIVNPAPAAVTTTAGPAPVVVTSSASPEPVVPATSVSPAPVAAPTIPSPAPVSVATTPSPAAVPAPTPASPAPVPAPTTATAAPVPTPTIPSATPVVTTAAVPTPPAAAAAVTTSAVNHLVGTAGDNLLVGGDGANWFEGLGGNDILRGGNGADRLDGGAGDDKLYGNGGDDRLFGGAGNDLLDGGAGADRMEGGAGDDSYAVDHAGDVVVELARSGTDTVSASIDYVLPADIEWLKLTGAASLSGTGNALDNRIWGNDGNNHLVGLDGNDSFDGGLGDDWIEGGNGNDEMMGAAGNDRLEGGAGNDKLYGNEGDDRLFGGAGNDLLDGGAGADLLEGGAGADVFRFAAPADSSVAARDVIADFVAGTDKIDLSQIDAKTNQAGDQAFTLIGTGGFSKVAGQLRYQVSTASDGHSFTLVEGDTDGNGMADFSIVLDHYKAGLSARDFVL